MLNFNFSLQLSLGCCWVQRVHPAMTPAVAPPSTASPFLFPVGSWCQDCSTFWQRPPRITNVQMRIGGESDPDSDVLQLVAGVKKKMLCQPPVCTDCIYACMHMSASLHVFLNMRPPPHHLCVYLCAHSHTFDVCMCTLDCSGSL